MNAKTRYLLAVDTGGTFTDVAVHDTETRETRFGKTLTNYADLVAGIDEGMRDAEATLAKTRLLKHGTTHVINIFIQRSGSRTALITTAGFRDILEIARGNRAVPFDLGYQRQPPLVPRHLRFEVNERIAADGEIITALDVAGLKQLAVELRNSGVEALAISFINSYHNDIHERLAKVQLAALLPDVFITTGTELSREWAEYERTSTAVANAYVGAKMTSYIQGFQARLADKDFQGAFYMMGSNGGVMSLPQTVAQPVGLVESGPIGGCIGAGAYASALGIDRMIALDMGGTTAKCALVENSRFDVQTTYYIGGYERGFPIRTPVLDIVEVGAGGGSIAWLDTGGRLQLGPRSAGSEPGPIVFGRGGVEPTVTDANAALGRIGSDSFVNGRLSLDIARGRAAIRDQLAAPLGFDGEAGVDRVAQGILDLATVLMTSAIKEITIERGRDVREFCLFAFGGGGPLFACELARALHIGKVVIPPHPGNFSSLGMLLADARTDISRPLLAILAPEALAQAGTILAEMENETRRSMAVDFDVSQIAFIHEGEMRYRGQKHTVRVRLPDVRSVETVKDAFEATYRMRYGHLNEGTAIEFIGLRAAALVSTERPDLNQVSSVAPHGSSPAPRLRRPVYFDGVSRIDTPVYKRSALPVGFELAGPAIVEEYSSTTVLGPRDHLRVGELGELVIELSTSEDVKT
jgi:N-methylhydantoinase A